MPRGVGESPSTLTGGLQDSATLTGGLQNGATLTGEELRSWAKVQLSAYKVPRLYQFVESLPKGATGKILKREIDRDAIRDAAIGATA